MKRLSALPLLTLLLVGCGGPHRHDVYLVDATASIVPASFDQAIKAIESEAEQLHRGDCVTVLPILSDSDSIPSDEIVRACVPTARTAYDQDLKDFHEQFRQRMEHEEHALALHRSAMTDILGSLKIVEQEFALDNPRTRKTVVVFSDFIEEDDARNFAKSPDLASDDSSERLALALATGARNGGRLGVPKWTGLRVLLGGLRSTETSKMSSQRKEGINRFWVAFFTALHARPFFAVDGPGMSLRFLAQEE